MEPTRRRARGRWTALALLAASTSAPWARDARAEDVPAPKEAAMDRVRSKDGTQIAYERSGTGPVVVLVSAALSSRSDEARLGELLSPALTVVRYDRRGRGDSTDTKPYAVPREVEDLEAVVDRVGGPVALYGSSSGAVLALEAAQRLRGKVRSLVLFEPPFVVDDSRAPVAKDFPARAARLVAQGKRSDAVALFMTEAVGIPGEFVAQMKEAPMWPAMERLAHTLEYDGLLMSDTQRGEPLPRDRWSAVVGPVLVIDGERSAAFLRNAAKALVGVLPDARQRTLEGQDHSAPYMAPESLVPAITEFLAKPPAAPATSKSAGSSGSR